MAAKNNTISANDLASFIKDWLKSKGYPRVKKGLKESGMPLCYSAYYQLRKSPNTALSVKSIEKVLNFMGYKAEISINIKINQPAPFAGGIISNNHDYPRKNSTDQRFE